MFRPQERNTIADGGPEILVVKESNEPLSRAILRGVSDFKGVGIAELDTLYYNINVTSTEMLMEHADQFDCSVTVKFTYEGCSITIKNNEEIKITASAFPCE